MTSPLDGFAGKRRASRRAAIVLVVFLAVVVGAIVLARRQPAEQPPATPGKSFVDDVRAARAVVWAVGDGPDGGVPARRVAQLIASDRSVRRVLYLGDTYAEPDGDVARLSGTAGPASDGAGALDNWGTRFAGAYGRRLAALTAPTPGNHDWPSDAEHGYLPYWQRVSGRSVPSYYSFRAAGWEILSLNSEAPHDEGSPQLRWLRDRVRAPGDCRIAFWHRPRFSAGTHHGDQRDVQPLWEAVRGRAAIVLGGHEHNMQRFKPIDGTVEFVSGAGGHNHYGVHEDDARIAFSNASDDGALRLELSPGRASWRFVTVDGETLDSGSLACQSQPTR